MEALRAELAHPPEAVILAEEALRSESVACLLEALETQSPWSDLPILVIGRDCDSRSDRPRALRALGNVTFVSSIQARPRSSS